MPLLTMHSAACAGDSNTQDQKPLTQNSVRGDFLSKNHSLLSKTHGHFPISETSMSCVGEMAAFRLNAALILELARDNYPQVLNQP